MDWAAYWRFRPSDTRQPTDACDGHWCPLQLTSCWPRKQKTTHDLFTEKNWHNHTDFFFDMLFIHKRLTCPRFFFKNIKMEAVRKFLIEVNSLPEPYWKQQCPWNRTWCRKSPIPTHWLYLELKNILTKRKILIMNLQQCHYGRQNQRINAN